MPQKRLGNLGYGIEYALVRSLLGVLNIFPFKQSVKIGGAFLGALIANVKPARSRIENNLRKIYPDMVPAEIRGITKLSGKFWQVFYRNS